jgi:glycyl-tRNA synthetase
MTDFENTSKELVELAKRRGFFVQSAQAYGGVSGFYSYGPQGAPLKRNVEAAWRNRFKVQEGHQEIDAPTVMPEPVFEASGHLDTFNDMLIECPECAESHRADHLIEAETDIEDAEALPLDRVGEIVLDNDISCPTCGQSLAGVSAEDFNLMFKTNIGPGSSSPGYLRPETVQGIFVEFPRLKEYARGQLPFGVTQIGRAYRNEISPRRSIIRTREFTQAELDLFINPEEHTPSLEDVADTSLTLYSAPAQQDDEGELIEMTVEEAAECGPIDSEWIAYYLGISRQWYENVGVDMDRFRFRQHLPGERSHYASDCWDAEAKIDGNWIELSGFSYRSDYDLRKHAEHSGEDFTIFKEYDREKTVKRPTLDIDMSELGPRFGETSKQISEKLEALVQTDPDAFEGETVTVEIDADAYEIPTELTGFEIQKKSVNGEHIVPHVVEPSFGIDRIVYTILHHNIREDRVDDENRTYLELEPEVAPTMVAVFPLMSQDGMADQARQVESRLRREGISTTYDDSGAIGRRYRRQDEIGTPFCVTVDHQTLDDNTVTLRERDSTDQRRIPIDDLIEVLSSLRQGAVSFDDLSYGYV